jgi:hypothetical protein
MLQSNRTSFNEVMPAMVGRALCWEIALITIQNTATPCIHTAAIQMNESLTEVKLATSGKDHCRNVN